MEEEDEGHHHHHNHRLCDYCESSIALIYCKADSAKLCFTCDKQVHVTNQLFSKHFRSLLCDSCNDSPSSVFSEIESSVLCQNCDWQLHTSSSSLHSRRRPVEGFSGCPSVTEFLSLVGIDDLSDKALSFTDSDQSSELLLWETPEIVSLNDLIDSNGSDHNFRAMDVPPLPKNRHATCGKHKEEMIRQLRELARTEPSCLKYEAVDAKVDVGFKFMAHENDVGLFSPYEVNGLKLIEDQQDEDFPYCSLLKNLSESDNVDRRDCPQESVMVPVSTSIKSTLRCHEINSFERNSALSRYKEKKKSRRYEKHIRYESRKARAESRTRIKGRFAKAYP